MPTWAQLGVNLVPKTAPRRARDRKKGDKQGETIEVSEGSRPELENGTQNDPPELNFGGFWHLFWKVFGLILEGFRRPFQVKQQSLARA